jgi:site-specific recombinase XerC
VEATREDIAMADRLMKELMARSLDELPPQTRKLLSLLSQMVNGRADFRFSRKDVREHTQWGHTQLKVHLHRLEELEYLIIHRGGRCQIFVYELNWSGPETEKSGPSRPLVGGVSGSGRIVGMPMNTGATVFMALSTRTALVRSFDEKARRRRIPFSRFARKASGRPVGPQLLRVHGEQPAGAYQTLSGLAPRTRTHRTGGGNAHGAGSYQRHIFHCRKRNGEPLGFTGQHSRSVPLRVWFRWMARQHYILHNPARELELPRVGMRLPKHVLTAEETELVLAQTNVHEPLGLRDRALLETLYSTGIRRLELVRLKRWDIDLERATVAIRQGKGKKDRIIPLGDLAAAWVRKYLDEARPQLASEPDDLTVFLSNAGEALSLDYLTQVVRGYVEAANVGKQGACHLFRHTIVRVLPTMAHSKRHSTMWDRAVPEYLAIGLWRRPSLLWPRTP